MLYIMRHGRTDWNGLHKLQGRTDIPLNNEGRRMAEKAGEECREIPLDLCYCSPLARARETAKIVLQGRGIPIIPDGRLKEMCFGEYEGVTDYFTNPALPISTLFQKPEAYKASVGGAETFDELFARTGAFLKEVIDPLMRQGKNVLIVGHGVMNISIISQIRHLPIEQFWTVWIDNCRMMRLI